MALGISQEKLGDALGVTFQQVQKYEKGKNRVAPSRLAAIAATLQVTPAFFFADTKSTGTPEILTLVGFMARASCCAPSRRSRVLRHGA
jgi:transcriptional regulator with XRE-family HTH domain